MVDWSNLKSYQNNKYRSFEELCYQIAKGLYGHLGSFTSIDDSGGGDGVEFYLTFPDGKQWGWQAKFYYPEPRLTVSSRKTSIKKSLQRACHVHKNLEKWFLCTPTKLTTSEQNWFDNTLLKSIPDKMSVSLEHWGNPDFNTWLSKPRFRGKLFYFFGELELTIEWFKNQFEKQKASIKDKFIAQLHTDTYLDVRIHELLCDYEFSKSFSEQLNKIEDKQDEFKQAVVDLEKPKYLQFNWEDISLSLYSKATQIEDTLSIVFSQLQQAGKLIEDTLLDELRKVTWDNLQELWKICQEYSELAKSLDVSARAYKGPAEYKDNVEGKINQRIFRPTNIIDELYYLLNDAITRLNRINQPDLHIFGRAGTGKTHIAAHIADERLRMDIPAICILGSKFSSNQPAEQQLKSILDIPPSYSWNDFIQALDAASCAYHTRIPIIIDGLNESTINGRFSEVWHRDMPGLIQEVSGNSNIVLITTCRDTYKSAIWANNDPANINYLTGFNNPRKIVEKYFAYYRIKADLTAAPLHQFHTPIFLRIFCEVHNPTRQEEKTIYVGEHTLYEVFDQYLEKCNYAICKRLDIYYKTPIIGNVLADVAEYIWQHQNNFISLAKLVEIADGQPIDNLQWESTRTKSILDEGLLVCRDWHNGEEFIFFTYQLLGGYVIADYLLNKYGNDRDLIRSIKPVLFTSDYNALHPLHDDICSCISLLLPVKQRAFLHELTNDKKAINYSLRALFEISPDLLTEKCINMVKSTFYSQNRRALFLLAKTTVGHVNHPLNASFWSKLLKELPMPDRDISWTEYLRKEADYFDEFIEQFETDCKSSDLLELESMNRMHLLAEHVQWILTSTVHRIRDKATKALYWYGRRFPDKLFKLTEKSFCINDPYVPERMLAASYGIAMAIQNEKEYAEKLLQKFARILFNFMFAKNAPYSTTHFLMRDYAKRIIDLALLHNNKLLSAPEKKRIIYPFRDGGIRKWGTLKNNGKSTYAMLPGGPDFNNKTVGYLIPDRHDYDFDNPEYKKVTSNLLWIINKLGYKSKIFDKIDKEIAEIDFRNTYWQMGKGKTDRYGKKYCWIAYYEVLGYRHDKGLLKEQWESYFNYRKRYTVDIDPSFPEKPHAIEIIKTDYLGKRSMSLSKWIEKSAPPDIRPYLVLDSIQNEIGPWVLLDGYFDQVDVKAKRRIFVFPRGLFIRKTEVRSAINCLKNQDLRGRWLPEIPETYYAYAGEIPWCETFPYNGEEELVFVISRKMKKVRSREIIPLKNGKNLNINDTLNYNNALNKYKNKKITQKTFEQFLVKNKIELTIVNHIIEKEIQKTKEFNIRIPVISFGWSESSSSINLGQHADMPSRELIEFLKLSSHPQTFDLYERTGQRATITIRRGTTFHGAQHLIYIRQDLLNQFLKNNKYQLVWGIWGERLYNPKDVHRIHEYAKKQIAYKVFQEVLRFNELNKK